MVRGLSSSVRLNVRLSSLSTHLQKREHARGINLAKLEKKNEKPGKLEKKDEKSGKFEKNDENTQLLKKHLFTGPTKVISVLPLPPLPT